MVLCGHKSRETKTSARGLVQWSALSVELNPEREREKIEATQAGRLFSWCFCLKAWECSCWGLLLLCKKSSIPICSTALTYLQTQPWATYIPCGKSSNYLQVLKWLESPTDPEHLTEHNASLTKNWPDVWAIWHRLAKRLENLLSKNVFLPFRKWIGNDSCHTFHIDLFSSLGRKQELQRISRMKPSSGCPLQWVMSA